MPKYPVPKMTEQDLRTLVDLFMAELPDGTRTLVITPEIEEDLPGHSDKLDYEPVTTDVIKLSNEGVPYCICEVPIPSKKPFVFYLYYDERTYKLRACRPRKPEDAFVVDEDTEQPTNMRAKIAAMTAYAAYCKDENHEMLAPNGIPFYADRAIAVKLIANDMPWSSDLRCRYYNEMKANMRSTLSDTDINWLAFSDAMLFGDNAFSSADSLAWKTCVKLPEFLRTNFRAPDDMSILFDVNVFADPEGHWPVWPGDEE